MIVSNLSIPLVGITDTAVMGHLDAAEYLAAVGAGAQIFAVIFMGLNFLRMGTTGLVAQAFGESSSKKLRGVLYQSCLTGTLLGLLLVTLQKPILEIALKLLDAGPDLAELIRQYYEVRIWSAPFTLVNFVLVGWLLGTQNAKGSLWVLLSITLTNIVLDLILVNGFHFKTDGVALASVIAEIAGLLTGLLLVTKSLKHYPGGWHLSQLFDVSGLRQLLGVNVNILIRTLALMFSFAFMTVQSGRLGTLVLAANTLLLNFQTFMAYGLDGFANAAEALVGKAIGAKERAGLEQAVSVCLRWSFGVSLAFSLGYLIFGQPLVSAMTSLDSVYEYAIEFLPWIIVLPIISVWSFAYDGIFVGATKAKQMRDAMLLSTFGVFVPAWLLFRDLQNHGLWLAFSLFMLARGVFMHLWFRAMANRGDLIKVP